MKKIQKFPDDYSFEIVGKTYHYVLNSYTVPIITIRDVEKYLSRCLYRQEFQSKASIGSLEESKYLLAVLEEKHKLTDSERHYLVSYIEEHGLDAVYFSIDTAVKYFLDYSSSSHFEIELIEDYTSTSKNYIKYLEKTFAPMQKALDQS